MTTDEKFKDERIQLATETPGLYPDKRWVDRVLACAGFLAFRIERYVEVAQSKDDFLGEFFQEKVQNLQQLLGRHGLSLDRTDGVTEKTMFNESAVPFEAVTVSRAGQLILQIRKSTKQADGLPGQGVVIGDAADSLNKAINFTNDLKEPLETLLHLGGIDGPIKELLKH